MAEEEADEKTQPPPSGEEAPAAGRFKLTPEQRRFLGPARTWHDQSPPSGKSAKSDSSAKTPRSTPPSREEEPKRPRRKRRWRLSRAVEKQNLALILGALLLLGLTFYFGKKFEYIRYLVRSRTKPSLSALHAKKFPDVSAEELIGQGLVEERLGNWKEAADRFIAAKYKNPSCPGLLFRVGKLYYDHNSFDVADMVLERAIAFAENMESANYYRGMIALGRRDLPAAERFFEAAATAAPFNADYYYSWAEALRRDHRPSDAIARYEQAAVRAGDAEQNICRFKIRMTMVEAGDIPQINAELEKKQSEGPLSVDWLMTAAALQIHAGNIDEAVRLVKEARASDRSLLFGHFAACAGDKVFSSACQSHAELAQACRVDAGAQSKTP